jgi:hypothetical protein
VRHIRVLVLVPALALGAPVSATAHADGQRRAAAHDAPVLAWTERALAEVRAHRVNPVRAARALALVSVAMNDATRRSRSRAAAHPAAATVLGQLFPDRRAALAARARAARVPPGVAAAATRAAARVIARARSDGSETHWSAPVPSGPGLWQPTPPRFAPPLDPHAGTWRTWHLNRGAQFRPPPPPAPGTDAFDAETQRVYDASRAASPEQRRLAHFWADGPGTVTPPGHWNQIALGMLRARGTGMAEAAALLAQLNTAQADAFIACWDAKFAYWLVRPVTVIQQWWYDPTWSPLLETPPFPAYPSGHATTSAAAATVLSAAFPDARRRLRRLAEEAAQSRLYAGIHFPIDTTAGLALGEAVAREALRSTTPKEAA